MTDQDSMLSLRLCRALLLGGVMIVTCGRSALAEPGDLGKGKQIATHGDANRLPACGGCHGAAGEGQAEGGIPRLAALPAGYLSRQLECFANGTRVNAVMTPFAKMMDAGTMTDLGAYYASLPPSAAVAKPREATASEDAHLASGRTLALRGVWAANVPSCASCHGLRGLGVGAAFPPLAGQGAAYISAQLQAWRTGSRHDDPLGLMRNVSARLDDAQIADVAAYYQSLPAAGAPR